MARSYRQGTYPVVNKEKYVGKKPPFFRSSYELTVFKYLDASPLCLAWGSEVVSIPYEDLTQQTTEGRGKKRRYVVDVWCRLKTRSGEIKECLIEIKPYDQTVPPMKGKKSQKNYNEQVVQYAVNQQKWKYARKYAADRGMEFKILTENEIYRYPKRKKRK